MASAQQLEKVEAALRIRCAEPGEVGIADLRAKTILGLVAGTGVIDRDPWGTRKPGSQCIASLGEKVVLLLDQETDHLALGNEDTKAAQQRHQSWHRRLSLMILGEHELA